MWPCQLGISLDALSKANPTKKQKPPHRGSGLCVEELSSKSSVLLHLHGFHLFKALPLSNPSQEQLLLKPRFDTRRPDTKRYFRTEDTNLIMLEMFDSCQGETGRTDGWSCKFSRIQHIISGRLQCFMAEDGTLIWGNQSLQSTWNNPFSDSHNLCLSSRERGLLFFTPESNIKHYLWMNN